MRPHPDLLRDLGDRQSQMDWSERDEVVTSGGRDVTCRAGAITRHNHADAARAGVDPSPGTLGSRPRGRATAGARTARGRTAASARPARGRPSSFPALTERTEQAVVEVGPASDLVEPLRQVAG